MNTERTDSGIYAIRNTHTQSVYIGCTTQSFKHRLLAHISDLSLHTHHNKLLQADYDRYGSDVFEFLMLEIISDDYKAIFDRERKWIDDYYDLGCGCYNTGEGVKIFNKLKSTTRTINVSIGDEPKKRFDFFMAWLRFYHPKEVKWSQGAALDEIIGTSKRWADFLDEVVK